MDEIPETGSEWIRLVNRRLTRLERRTGSRAAVELIANGAFLMPADDVPDLPGWAEVEELAGEAPAGWVYVRRAQPPEPI